MDLSLEILCPLKRYFSSHDMIIKVTVQFAVLTSGWSSDQEFLFYLIKVERLLAKFILLKLVGSRCR